MILVTGANGTIGSHLVGSVVSRGGSVRVLVRDTGKAQAIFGDRVDIVRGDLTDPSSVTVALKGVDSVFLNSPSLEGFVGMQRSVIDAAVAEGVGHLVRISVAGAAPDSTTSYGRGHFALDEYLKSSPLSRTILQPSAFMQNLLASAGPVKNGALYASAGDAAVSMVDARDIADVAATVLTGEGYAGQTLLLTGGQAVTYADVAAVLTTELGHDVRYVDVPPDVTRNNLLGFGLPAGQVDDIVALFAIFRAGLASGVSPVVQEVLGRAPSSLGTFVHDYRSAFTEQA